MAGVEDVSGWIKASGPSKPGNFAKFRSWSGSSSESSDDGMSSLNCGSDRDCVTGVRGVVECDRGEWGAGWSSDVRVETSTSNSGEFG